MAPMARAVWTGSISFGLVTIPVRMYPATASARPRFHMVDRETGRRIRYRRVVEEPAVDEPPVEEAPPAEAGPEPLEDQGPRSEAPAPPVEPVEDEVPAERPRAPAEREVPYSEVVRGYDVGGGEHVVVEPEELEALRPEPSRTIEIEHFVTLSDVDPVHFDKSYHLGPADDLGVKPYTLLRVAMERTGRAAVGRFVLRSREHLVVIRPTAGILGLETMYFEDELRRPAERWTGEVAEMESELTDAEVNMAERLIDALGAVWEPSRYRDPYRERMMELIRSRAPVPEPAAAEEPAEASVVDLMAVLKASVEAIDQANRPKRRRAGRSGSH
jgi:DNA end-binding protein Ku